MPTLLESVRKVTKIDLDAIDADVATKYAPIQDMTCNQFIVQATLTDPQHASVLAFATQEAYKIAKEFNVDVNSKQDFAQFVIDIASVHVSKDIKPKLHPQGYVLLQTCCSKLNSTDDVVDHSLRLTKLFERVGIPKTGSCIKVPSTLEGLRACRILKNEHNVNTLGTTVFCMAQAMAAAQAGCLAISPYLNELDAHFNKDLYINYSNPVKESPGVMLTHAIQRTYRNANIKTQVKAASFITALDVVAMAGVDAVTIGPAILTDLSNIQLGPHEAEILTQSIEATEADGKTVEETNWLDDQALEFNGSMNDPEIKRLQTRANEVFINAEEQLRALATLEILNHSQQHIESI